MKKSGLGRALRYFIRLAELYMLCVIGGSFAMSVYVWLLNDYGMSLSDMLRTVPSGAVCTSMLVLFSSSMSAAQYSYSIPVSFGCCRRNVFLGSLAMDLLLMAESTVFYMLMVRILQTDDFTVSAIVILTLFLVLAGISKIMAIAAMKWGKRSYVVMMSVIVIGIVFVGLLTGFAGTGEQNPLEFIVGIYDQSVWRLAGLLAGAVICAAANVAGYLILKNFEVKV